MPTISSGAEANTSMEDRTIFDLVSNDDSLFWFMYLVDVAGMEDVLRSSDALTVFAPDNDAFRDIDRSYLLLLLISPEYRLHVTELLQLHLSPNYYPTTVLVIVSEIDTLLQSEGEITVAFDEAGLLLAPSTELDASVRILDPDHYAKNGVLHIVDGVLFPKFASLNPLSFLFETLSQGNDQMHSFLSLVVASGLDDRLEQAEDITLFAPVNGAIPDDVFDFLLDSANAEYLKEVVNHHIVSQVINFEDLNATVPSEFTPVHGEVLRIFRDKDALYVNDAIVLDFGLVRRGIVYQLDSLMMPSQSNDVPTVIDSFGEAVPSPIKLMIPRLNGLLTMNGFSAFSRIPEDHALLSRLPASVKLFDNPVTPSASFTVFIPNSFALASITDEYKVKLVNPEYELHLAALWAFHSIPQSLNATNLLQTGEIETLSGDVIDITGSTYAVFINSAAKTPATIQFSTPVETVGMVHVIDHVLLPSWTKIPDHISVLAGISSYSSFLRLLVGTGLDVTVGSYAAATILAPDNTALSDDLVTYLLSPGREALARTITRYNIIPKLSTHLMAAQEQEGRLAVTTLHGLTIDLQVEANNIVLAGTTARLLAFSLTSQGIVYRSDRLLLPPEARIYVPSTFRPPSRVEIPPLSRLEFPMVLPTTP